MTLHEELYAKLFKGLSRIIEESQKLQQECEEMYTSFAPEEPVVLKTTKKRATKND